jgi:hypothetical protein
MHINPYMFIATVILIAVFWYMRRRKAQEAGGGPRTADPQPVAPRVVKPKDPPEVVYMNLRKRILETSRDSLGLPVDPADANPTGPYGLVMEMGISDSAVMLACFANGDAGV